MNLCISLDYNNNNNNNNNNNKSFVVFICLFIIIIFFGMFVGIIIENPHEILTRPLGQLMG
ncbi:MAG: hypothetical protein N7Q72_01140, partial [Spiroplasma sp. Tabriz.8]|nr:hypothetical protein [Candidatus Regiella insecticola]MCZ8631847.1 hypothetical protein [Spiroplasma sp. Tabriz.8]